MNIFFDVDFTILGLDNTLRPGTRELFDKLVKDGHKIYIWSGVGARHQEIKNHELGAFVSGIYTKPLENFRVNLERCGIPIVPDFVLDDYPEIVAAFGGVYMLPYLFYKASDDEMEKVYRILSEYICKGYSEDHRFRLKEC